MFQDYPMWISVDGPGHPQNPGFVLVNSEAEAAEAKASGAGPASLNPPPDPGQKSLDEMDRQELIKILVSEGIPDDMSDEEIRNAIRHGREQREEDAKKHADEANADEEARQAAGDHGDGMQTAEARTGQPDANTDAAGDTIADDTADLANNVPGGRKAKANSAADATPADGDGIPAADAPAGNVSDQAMLSPDDKKAGK